MKRIVNPSIRPERNTNRIPVEENRLILKIKLNIKAKIATQKRIPQLIISDSSIFTKFLLMIVKTEKKKVATMTNRSPK